MHRLTKLLWALQASKVGGIFNENTNSGYRIQFGSGRTAASINLRPPSSMVTAHMPCELKLVCDTKYRLAKMTKRKYQVAQLRIKLYRSFLHFDELRPVSMNPVEPKC